MERLPKRMAVHLILAAHGKEVGTLVMIYFSRMLFLKIIASLKQKLVAFMAAQLFIEVEPHIFVMFLSLETAQH